MPGTVRLFLYGTLQPGAGTVMGDWISARLVRGTGASAPGRLHGLRSKTGWFPALIPARGFHRVPGTLCEVRLRPGELAVLDRYEGGEYRRVTARVRTASGETMVARLYLWRVALPPDAPAIAGGDFLRWLRSGRRRSFGT